MARTIEELVRLRTAELDRLLGQVVLRLDPRDLTRSLANTPEGQDLTLSLANTPEGRALTRSLANTPEGQDLARSLANTPEGQDLARSLANTPEGQDLALSLANTPEGRALALSLANTPEGRALARSLANTPEGRDLALSLANTPEGRALARSLANTPEGQDLARSLANTPEGKDLALSLANTPEGRALALSLANTPEGRDLTRSLANTPEGRALARSLANTPEGRDLALSLANTPEGRALALSLANTPEGQDLARSLANTPEGKDLARTLANTPEGKALASILASASVLFFTQMLPALSYLVVIGGAAGGVLVSAKILIDEDDETETDSSDEPVEAVAVLAGSDIGESQRLLEPVLGQLQQLADADHSPLDPVDEQYLRVQIETIRIQHRTIDEVDATIVTRSIGNIITRLLRCGTVGAQARQLLEELEAEPPEVIDEIIRGIETTLVEASRLALAALDANRDAEAAAVPIVEAADAAEDAEQLLSQIPDARSRLASKAKYVARKTVDGAAEHVGEAAVIATGAAAATHAPTLLSLLATAIAQVSGVGLDAVFITLVDLMPQLREIYTTYRQVHRGHSTP